MQELDFDPNIGAPPAFGLVDPAQTTESTLWLGLDVGRYRTHLCVTDNGGKPLFETACSSKPQEIANLLSDFPIEQIGLVGLESGAEPYLVRKLRTLGYPVAIFEARKTSKFLAIRRNKTDSGDAKGLADVARLGRNSVSQVHLKSLECQQLRSTLATRQLLMRFRVSTELRIRSLLALHGRGFKRCRAKGGVRMEAERQIAELLAEEGIDLWPDLGPLIGLSDLLREHLDRIDTDVARFAGSHPVCRRLMQVPGVGPLCALSFYSAIEDPDRFRRTSDVGAYLGLVPRRYQSGQTSRTRGITKTGNRMTRSHLVTSATVLRTLGRDCALKQWATQLAGRIGSTRSRVALARKLAILLLRLWKREEDFIDFPESRNASPKDANQPRSGDEMRTSHRGRARSDAGSHIEDASSIAGDATAP